MAHKPATMTASRAASVGPGEYVVSGHKGLYLLVRQAHAGHSRSWVFRFSWAGSRIRIVLGALPAMTLAGAQEAARAQRANLDQGIDPRRARSRRPTSESPKAPPVDPHTVAHLASEFMDRYVRPNRRRPDIVQHHLDKDVLPSWKHRDARTITPREVIDLLDGIVDRGAPAVANDVAQILGQMFKFGIHRRIVEASPVQLLFKPGGKEKPRSRALSDPELAALLSIEPLRRWARLHHAINLLLLTGVRRGELALARWTEFDLDRQDGAVWHLPGERTKTGAAVLVPLVPAAVKELRALKREGKGSPWLFPNSVPEHPADPKLLTRNLARALERFADAGIGAFTLHDLRRTVRTGLARLKVAPHIAERVLNHAQERIAGTYDVHDYAEEKRAAIQLWADHLQRLRA